jgi:DNA-binding SARP family transcriptional activator
MQFRVLGTVGVVGDEGEVALGGPRQRRLLAVLLLGAGRTVSTDRIVTAVWGDGEPPDGASKTLLSYVSRLRSALGDGWVVTAGDGYVLERRQATMDADRFEELVDRARTAKPADALATLDEALALWHGRAFGELADEEWCRGGATRLEELRLVALELRS